MHDHSSTEQGEGGFYLCMSIIRRIALYWSNDSRLGEVRILEKKPTFSYLSRSQ